MRQDMISVIIPVYNSEKTLNRCLESICGQSYFNLEIICVNDGSTDSSSDIIREWQKKDNRIICLYQENRGVAAARNLGLSSFRGQYFAFVDADDMLEPLMYEKLYEAINDQDADIAVAAIREIYFGDRIEVRNNNERLCKEYLSGTDILCSMLRYEGGIRTVVWDKLYRASLLGDVRFDENCAFGEDALFNFEAMIRCNKCCRISYIGYTYDHRFSQVTGKKYGSSKMSNVYVCRKIIEYCKMGGQLSLELQNAADQFAVGIYRQLFYQLLLEREWKKQHNNDYTEIKKAAKDIDSRLVRKFLSPADYVQWLIYCYAPDLFCLIHKIHHLQT